MNETFTINREFLFKSNIHEITSISIEHNFDINGSYLEGEFIVSGDYRLHEISINKEDFSFKIPFKHEIRSNINLDTVEVEITDFSYDFRNDDELEVHIEYIVSGEQGIIEFEDEKSLDDFLSSENVEVVDLSSNEDERQDVNLKIDESNTDEIIKEESKSNEIIDSTFDEQDLKEDNKSVKQDLILNSVTGEDTFVKYHVHTVTMEDSIEGICNKYGITINTLKKYNSFETLELNMKLLIPENEEN